MDDLAIALQKLSVALQTEPNFFAGKLEVYDSPIIIEQFKNIHYSEELIYFYQNYNYDFCGVGTVNICFTSHDNLLRRQNGFGLEDGRVVIADLNDDPITVDTNISGSPVFAAIEARDYKEISPSLSVFFILCELLITNSNEYQPISPDPENDFEAYIDYEEKVINPAFLDKAKQYINADHLANIGEFLFS